MKRSRYDDRGRGRGHAVPVRPLMHPERMPFHGSGHPQRGPPQNREFGHMEPYRSHTARPPGVGFHQENAHHPDDHFSRHQEPPRKKLFIPKEELSDVARDCIERIAESKKFVSVERIERLLLQHYGVGSLAEIDVQKVEHIASVNEHVRLQAKVNAYIQAFVKCRVIGTLFELEEALTEFAASGKEFSSLRLGPLTEQPLVYEYFRFPSSGVDIPSITAIDILQHLRDFLTENNLWTKRADLQDFMKFITERTSAKSPYELGVRITSIGLAIQVLKRAQKDASRTIQMLTKQLTDMAENNLCKAFEEFTHSVIEKDPGYCSVRREYARMPLKQLIDVVFRKLNVLFTSINYLNEQQHNRHLIPAVNKTQMLLHKFVDYLHRDKLLQKLFQFAVCCSTEEIHLQLTDILGFGNTATPTPSVDEVPETKPKPLLCDVVQLIKKYLERCLAHGSLSLSHLCRIENKLLEEFGFPHFSALGHGTFLDVVTSDSEVRQLMEDNGTGLVGLSPASIGGRTVYLPSKQDLLSFVSQCGPVDQVQSQSLEDALCYHYDSPDFKSLRYGSFSHLLQNVENDPHKHQNPCVIFESALVARSRSPCLIRGRNVGVLGHVTKEKALACLQNCPLLDDLHEWSQWHLVFEPELGSLKDFVEKFGGSRVTTITDGSSKLNMTTSVLALEVRPGVLLKITADTSTQKLASAMLRTDVRETCGHLVSVIVTNKGLENTGLMLLGNHMKTAIIKLASNRAVDGSPDGATEAAKFVLDCLTFLPKLLCLSLAEKVFLEPLSEVIGQSKSRELLLQLATSSSSRACLQLIGMTSGLEEWGRTFQEKMTPSQDCVETLNVIELEDVIVVDDQSDEESEISEENEDEINDIFSEEGQILPPKHQENDVINLTEDDSEVQEATSCSTKEEDVTHLMEFVGNNTDNIQQTTLSDSSLNEFNPCKAVVDEIRREEFGIDVVLSENGQKLMVRQQERLGRSLDRLSSDLYSKDTHFVLELIQNADDNDYPEEMYRPHSLRRPSIKFIIEESAISVLNNECGFLEKHIRALCDVGRTTKGKHKRGYIGQKGIGFKSVFRVTDRPEIHSNGYHICFDVNSSPSGYILPHWIEADQEQHSSEWTTRIVLPLKASVQSLAAKFHDICPSLLLFLHRIKSLSIVNKVDGYNLKFERSDLSNNITEIKHSKCTDVWFVVRKTLDAQKISVQAKSGVDIDSTDIAMAFPLVTKEQARTQFQPPKQPVFAFLPLRSFGFRFIIQADFDVPSSRETVDRDSLWNQWLISELPLLFLEALKAFKEHPAFDELEGICRILQFVPLEDEILDFFRPVATHITKQLQALPCLPAASNSKKLTWKMPSQLIVSEDAQLQDVIPSSLLTSKLGLDYLHPDVAAIMSPTLMASLGIRKLSVTHLTELGRSVLLEQHNATGDSEQIVWIAKWFSCMYRTMDEFQDDTEMLEELARLPAIPLVDGRMVAIVNKPVFFPPESGAPVQLGHELLMLIYQDLNTVHPLLLQCQDSVMNSQVSHLLNRLGVKQLTPRDIIHHHILPVLETDQWKNKSEDHLVAYLTYIKTHLDHDRSLVSTESLRDVAVVLTNHGPVKATCVDVHFTTLYLNQIDLQQSLPGYDWVLLDSRYLAGVETEISRRQWRDFFSKLGVIDFLSLKAVHLSFTEKELVDSPWAGYKDLLPPAASYKLTDRRSIEAEMLICKNTQTETYLDQMRTLFEFLDQTWEHFCEKDLSTHICNGNGEVMENVETSFAMLLKSAHWVPAVECTVGENAVLTFETKPLKADSLFFQNENTRKLLASHVPYLDAKVSSTSSFAQFLGIKLNVTVSLLKDLLVSWCQREGEMVDEPTSFTTSVNHIKAVYHYLYDHLPPKQFQDLFNEHPAIFVTDEDVTDHNIPVTGRFLARHEVRWSDPSGLFVKYKLNLDNLDHEQAIQKPELASLYGDMSEIFLKAMAVEPKPSLESYTQLMLIISASATGTGCLMDMLRIVTVLGLELMECRQAGQTDVSLQIRNIKLLMGTKKCLIEKQRHIWLSLIDRPLIADDPQLEKMFRNHDGVYFVECGERFGNRVMTQLSSDGSPVLAKAMKTFYEAIGLEYLSQCVEIKSVTEMYSPCPSLQAYVTEAVCYIQRLLLVDYPEIYLQLQAKEIGRKLSAMTFAKVSRLERIYTLKYFPQAPVVQNEKTEFNIEENQFIVHKDCVNSYLDINKELARYFSQGNVHCFRQLKEMLNDLQTELRHPLPNMNSFADEHNIAMLPEQEQAWTVPEVITGHDLVECPSSSDSVDCPSSHAGVSRPQLTKDNKDGQRCLPVWPPRVRVNKSRADSQEHSNEKRAGSCIWPPPKPPQSTDVSGIRTNLTVSDSDGVVIEICSSPKRSVHCPESDGSENQGGSVSANETSTEDEKWKNGAKKDVILDNNKQSKELSVDGNRETSTESDMKQGEITNQMLSSKKTLRLYGPRMWTEHSADDAYEDIDSKLMPPDRLPLHENPDRHEVAIWGEALVKKYLEELARDANSGIRQVIWLNEEHEQALPYDLIIQMATSNNETDGGDVYVEVKATESDDKAFFEISPQQFEFAQQVKERYHVYRVFGVGRSRLRLSRLVNLAEKLRLKQVKLYLVM